MKEFYKDNLCTIYNDDCLNALKEMPENSIDAVVTDPPYGLTADRCIYKFKKTGSGNFCEGREEKRKGFMGKEWDGSGIEYNVDLWRECLRVLKPGGHILAFGGTRTFHRMVCAMEDAGFEIRDMLTWVHGQGFPKSHNIGLAIDKLQKNEREIISRNPNSRENCDKTNTLYESGTVGKTAYITKGNSGYDNLGTALKPAIEPITLARKPIEKRLSIAENVLKYGTGGINIDGCRIPYKNKDDFENHGWMKKEKTNIPQSDGWGTKDIGDVSTPSGRFPSNFIHDGSEEVVGMFPQTKTGSASGYNWGQGKQGNVPITKNIKSEIHFGDSGSAARFFYCAKASKRERQEGCDNLEEKKGIRSNAPRENETVKTPLLKNNHPTVKPLSLCMYLIKLITTDRSIVLDPFMGSGTTGIACKKLNRKFIGIERETDYCEIAKARISYNGETTEDETDENETDCENEEKPIQKKSEQTRLF